MSIEKTYLFGGLNLNLCSGGGGGSPLAIACLILCLCCIHESLSSSTDESELLSELSSLKYQTQSTK